MQVPDRFLPLCVFSTLPLMKNPSFNFCSIPSMSLRGARVRVKLLFRRISRESGDLLIPVIQIE
jgi:hypothetical protein